MLQIKSHTQNKFVYFLNTVKHFKFSLKMLVSHETFETGDKFHWIFTCILDCEQAQTYVFKIFIFFHAAAGFRTHDFAAFSAYCQYDQNNTSANNSTCVYTVFINL